MYRSSSTSSSLEGSEKKSLRRIEIALNKFNEVAVPYHVDLINQHVSNIQRYERLGQLSAAHREHINAGRAVQQLKALIYDMDSLRSQLYEDDLAEFSRLTAKSRQNVQEAIQNYLDMKKPDISKLVSSNEEWAGERQEGASFQESKIPHLQVQLNPNFEEKELAKKEAYLQSWEQLQTEFEDLQQLFQDFAALVESQGELVTKAETQVETTQENVEEGARQLAYASKLKVASYPLFGALLGGCVGGPIGLVAGMKLGGLAAIGGGILGFTGGKFLKNQKITEDVEQNTAENSDTQALQQPSSVTTVSKTCLSLIS